MIAFIRKVRELFTLSDRVNMLTSEMNEIEEKIKLSIVEYSKQFEKKIQEMTFAYTRDLDDTKSDYLKRYLEVRLNCMQGELMQLPRKFAALQMDVERINEVMDELSIPDNKK